MGLSSNGNGVKQTFEKWGTPAHKMQLQRVSGGQIISVAVARKCPLQWSRATHRQTAL